MPVTGSYFIKFLLVVVAYAALGRLALTLAIPPGFSAPIWPSAAVALVAVLLGGYRYLPAVFLGAIGANLIVSLNLGGDISTLRSMMPAILISAGATLQTAFAVFVIKKFNHVSNAFNTYQSIVSFVFWGGLIACLVNGFIGPATLYFFDILPAQALASSIFTWWVGDAIGVVLFAPMLLILLHQSVSGLRKIVIALPVLLFAAIAIFTFFSVKQANLEKGQSDFDVLARSIATEFEKNIQIYLNILEANASFINASDYVSAEEFQTFTKGFVEKYPSIQSLSWNRRVTSEERDEYEKEIQDQGFSNFTIKDRFGVGRIDPAPEREVYFPVTYLNPYTGNNAAHGYDTYGPDEVTDNIRQKVLDQARDEGRAIVTGRIAIVQAEGRYGLLIYHPVYGNTSQGDSIASRRKQLIGYTAGVFIMPEMLKHIAVLAEEAGLDFSLNDLDAPNTKQLLYESRTVDHQEPVSPIPTPPGALISTISFDVAGHRWQLVFVQKPESVAVNQGWDLWYLLVGGLLISSVFGVFLIIISAKTEEIKEDVNTENLSNILLLPALSSVIVLIITIALWQQFKQQESRLIHTVLKEEIATIHDSLSFSINNSIVALGRMARRWETSDGLPKAQWEQDAKYYVEDFSALTTVQWVDDTYHVRWIEPLEGNEKAMGINIAFNDERKNALKGAIDAGSTTITPPLDLVQGYPAIIAYIPLHVNGQFDGFIVGIYNTDTILKNIFSADKTELFDIEIKDGEKIVFRNIKSTQYDNDATLYKDLTLFNRTWKISLSPKNLLLKARETILPEITLLGGVLFSLLMGFAVYASIISNRRSKLLNSRTLESQEVAYRLKSILDNIPNQVFWKDSELVYQGCSKKFAEVVGLSSSDEVIGKTDFDFVRDTKHARSYQEWDRKIMRSRKAVIDIEEKFDAADGEQGYVLTSKVPIIDINNNVTGILGICTDITERKHGELEREKIVAQLAALNEFNEAILNSSKHFLISTDLNGNVTQFNTASQKALGYKAEEVVAKLTPAIWHDMNEVVERAEVLSKELGEKVEPGFDVFVIKARKFGPDSNEWTFIRKDGSRFPVNLTVTCMRNENEEITGYLGVIEDITERKRAEEEREELIEQLRTSNKDLDEFAYVASHDLKAPLRVIDNASSWLMEDLGKALEGDDLENLQLIRGRTARMEKLLDDLLEYSRIGRKTDQRYSERMSGDTLLEDVLLLVNKPEGFTIQVSPQFADIAVNCMPLEHIFINLINNAIKHHDRDKGLIEIDVKDEARYYQFSVKDDGPGIPEKYHDKVFGMFQTLKSRDRVEGSGMGLAMVKKHVESVGGSVLLESEEGKGSIFTIKWPKL